MTLFFVSISLVFFSVVLAIAFIFLRYRFCEQKEYASVLEDTLRVGGAGVLIFDDKDRLKHANAIAENYFETLRDRDVVLNLNDFISYIFDHASEEDVSIPEHFSKTADFREIVIGDDGCSYLVEMHKLQKGRTIALVRDVSQLRAQDEDLSALNKDNETLSLAVESTSCGVFIINAKDADMPVIFLNRMCRDIGAFDHGVLPRSFVELFISFGKKKDETEALFEALKNHEEMFGRDSFQKQVQFHKDETERWFDFRLTPIFDRDDKIDLFIGVLSDVTALKHKEKEFNRAQKLDSLGQLSAGIAHDFNNILSIVEGYARMIEMNADSVDRMLEYAKKIQNSSVRGAGLTKKMMAFARHKIAQDSVSDLKTLLYEQETLLKPLIDETIGLTITCNDDDLYGRCDSDSFTQIMMNLVINSRDAVESGGQIKVYLEDIDSDLLPEFVKDRTNDYLCLRVMDNGLGMSKDVCERIFDPFFTTKEQGQGTGLGLSVIYGLVKDMGGYIDVRSELSVGTEFSVYIPRADTLPDNIKRLEGDRADVDSISFQGYTAFIVEDESDLREILATFLRRRGMNVLEAENGNDALVLQDDYEDDIDVLITDLVMPGITGLKLADMIKALRPDIHTVFMSGYPARGEDSKVDIPSDAVFMPKPLDFDSLCVNLFETLNKDQTNVVPINTQKSGEIR